MYIYAINNIFNKREVNAIRIVLVIASLILLQNCKILKILRHSLMSELYNIFIYTYTVKAAFCYCACATHRLDPTSNIFVDLDWPLANTAQ